jgi:hypothetical protein
MTPFFIFDGQAIVGQDEVAVRRGLDLNLKTDGAWELYFNSRADEAVHAFGQTISMCAPAPVFSLLNRSHFR